MPSLLEYPEKTITILIQNFVTKSSKNRASKLDGAPFFEAPLVGFADAYDVAMPGCGLCQTAVPCEVVIPNKLK